MRVKCSKCNAVTKLNVFKKHYSQTACSQCKTPIFKHRRTVTILDYIITDCGILVLCVLLWYVDRADKLKYLFAVFCGVIGILTIRCVVIYLLANRKNKII
jgi:hypothetical protein